MPTLHCKHDNGLYSEAGLKFKNGKAEVSAEELTAAKKSKHYGVEFATLEDARWLDKEQKAKLAGKPVVAESKPKE